MKRKISLLVIPLIIILIYVIFGVSYYSITTSILFSIYMLTLFVLGGVDKSIKTVIIGISTILMLVLQWYSIYMTLEWLNSSIYGDSWGYGTDFLVIVSGLSLILFISVLNYRTYKKIS